MREITMRGRTAGLEIKWAGLLLKARPKVGWLPIKGTRGGLWLIDEVVYNHYKAT